MKKTGFFILLVFACRILNAQEIHSNKNESQVSFGIKGGINFADYFRYKFPSGTEPGMDWSISFHSGITMNIPLQKMYSLQPELLYTGAGSKLIVTKMNGSTSSVYHYEQRYHYISLPILLRHKNEYGFLIETGPVPAYLLNAKQIDPAGMATNDRNSLNKFDLSWAFGVGYASQKNWGAGIRYDYGLTSVLPKENMLGFPVGSRLQNSVVQIGIDWQFGCKSSHLR